MSEKNISEDTTSDNNSAAQNTPTMDLSERLGYLAMLLRRTDMASRHGGRPFGGIRAGQGRVLGILALQSPMPQKNLAFMLGVRPQSLSELLSKLEAADLVTRRRDDTDRRTFVVELTDEGRTAAAEVSGRQEDDPFSALSDEEQEQFTDLIDRVIASAEGKFPELRERREAMSERGDFPPFGGFRGGRGRGRRDGHGGHGDHGDHGGRAHHGHHDHRDHHPGGHVDCDDAGDEIRRFIAGQMRHFGFGGHPRFA